MIDVWEYGPSRLGISRRCGARERPRDGRFRILWLKPTMGVGPRGSGYHHGSRVELDLGNMVEPHSPRQLAAWKQQEQRNRQFQAVLPGSSYQLNGLGSCKKNAREFSGSLSALVLSALTQEDSVLLWPGDFERCSDQYLQEGEETRASIR